MPKISLLKKFSQALKAFSGDTLFFFDLEATESFSEVVRNYDSFTHVGLCIGPEGGWSLQEREQICAYPFVKKVSLGSYPLRAETAALAALSLTLL